jgi:adenylylsulfate kinase
MRRGRLPVSETRRRSVAKAASWRVLATLTTIAIVLLVTGEIDLALAVGGIEVAAKLLVFYVHERTWQRIGWGSNRS